ncbi:hypothetical protein BFW38_05805 [Terasakiispira papahanaumokuakeensis]|uniref:PAAR domain-containing protein n=1 Tax=Terasakiispira papahanaumokuakeensis TaxID=197479 RepID=A0A1E2V7Z2_9GAMM|nr:PAAR domain-containing protein [Terasakiispira papahanaumokuakeensis]ODC03130.1 hypothetical protein BFW38_05805 [Terasakiispira papahanaumokuakeensis]
MQGVIVVGDITSHGGTVVSGQPNYLLEGIPVACVGDAVVCKIHGPGVIIEGHPTWTINGKPVALHGHQTSCGATLISSHIPVKGHE